MSSSVASSLDAEARDPPRAPDTSRDDGDRAGRPCRTARWRDRFAPRAPDAPVRPAPSAASAAHASSSGPNVGCARSRKPGARSGRPSRRAASLKLAAAKYRRLSRLNSGGSRHRRVQRGDEPLRRVQLGERRLARKSASAASRSAPGDVRSSRSTSRRMPSSVSGKPVDSSGSMTPAADGSSAQPGPRRVRCGTPAEASG